MSSNSRRFTEYWEECYNAVYYHLCKDKTLPGLRTSVQCREIVRREVWQRRFRCTSPCHGACSWLEQLAEQDPVVAGQVRARIAAFQGAGGVNKPLALGLMGLELLLLVLTAVAVFLPWMGLLALLLAACDVVGFAAVIALYLRSAKTGRVMQQAFQREGDAIRDLLEKL